MTLPCGKWKVEIGHSETWCENGSKVKRQALRAHSDSSRVLWGVPALIGSAMPELSSDLRANSQINAIASCN